VTGDQFIDHMASLVAFAVVVLMLLLLFILHFTNWW